MTSPYDEALNFLYDRINYERMAGGTGRYPFRLQRIESLMGELGLEKFLYQPTRQPVIPLIHLAGTKGKGSTATMIAAGLSAAGLKTGLYTSPHLHRLEERFRVDGTPCSKEDLIELVHRIRPLVHELDKESGQSPSFFELTTAMSLMHFDSSGCEAIVLEVGLGGRLDSTNVCSPSVTAITSIGLDHQQVLGDTIEAIAAEKAGIIKFGIPVVSGVQNRAAQSVIADVAANKQAPLYQLGVDLSCDVIPQSSWGSRIMYRGKTPMLANEFTFDLPLDGEHQARNATIALACLNLLASQGIDVSPNDFADGLASVVCEGRIERIPLADDTIAIVDAAHNDDSIEALCRCLQDRFGDQRVAVVFGTSRDKKAAPMLAQLGEIADVLILTQYRGNPRFQPTDMLLPLLPDPLKAQLEVQPDPIKACQSARDHVAPGGVLVVCGSFFLAAETREWLANQCGPKLRGR